MTYEESVARLVNHANLPSELPEDESWGVCLFKASSTKLVPPIDALMLDVIGCLDVVNKELNGAVPSKRGTPPRESIATILAYAMSCIIEDGIEKHRDWGRRALFDQRTLDLLERSTPKISYAWGQVLAGDIDDLLEGFDWM